MSSIRHIILDASVGVKWIFEENLEKQADLLADRLHQGKIRIIVPEFFFVELANSCWTKVKKERCTMGWASEGFDRVSRFPLKTYADRELSGLALDNAFMHGISAYDGLYLALAEIYVAPLITADRRLFDACKNRFDFIEFLGDVEV